MKILSDLPKESFLNEWSGTEAHLEISSMPMHSIAGNKSIPSLAAVNSAMGVKTLISLVSNHLLSVCKFSNVTLSENQAAEMAIAISTMYWYINVAELSKFFSELKYGKYGQFIWGAKLNNQQVMVFLEEFVINRRNTISEIEKEKRADDSNKGFATIVDSGIAITRGLNSLNSLREKAKGDYEAFRTLYPSLPSLPDTVDKDWWMAWKGDKDSKVKLFGGDYTKATNEYISKLLCQFNIKKLAS